LFELFLDVITLTVSTAIRNVVRRVHGATGELPSIVSGDQRAINEVSAISEAGLTTLVSGVIARKRHEAHAKEDARQATEKQSASQAFLAAIEHDASERFRHLKHTVPAGATDAELLVLSKVMEPQSGHRFEDYFAQLRGKLDRFKRSGLAQLGVSRNQVAPMDGLIASEQEINAHFRIATRLFWVSTPNGRRLALYRRGHRDVPKRIVPNGSGVSRPPTIEEVSRMEEEDLMARPFQFYKYVPNQLMAVALELHRAKWSSDPAEHGLGYAELRAIAWDP
jgi:hypothetical protein